MHDRVTMVLLLKYRNQLYILNSIELHHGKIFIMSSEIFKMKESSSTCRVRTSDCVFKVV